MGPRQTTNGNFQLARDRVVLLETVENLCANWCQVNDFSQFLLPSFQLGGITKHWEV